MTAHTSPAPEGRIAWLDLVRAISIVLVVLYHVGAGAGNLLLPADSTTAGQRWASLNLMLAPVRMPLFFMVSGMLAVRAVHRPWRAVVRPRLLDFAWPYLLWSALFAVTAWTRYAPLDPAGYMWDQVKVTLTAMGPYWFIAVLPVFFLVARCGRRRPRLLLAIAAAVYVAAWPLRALMLEVDAIPALAAEGMFRCTIYAVWYIAGYVLRDRIIARAERAHLAHGLVAAGLFLAVTLLRQEGGGGVFADRVLLAAATLSGLAAAVVLATRVVRIGAVARGGRWLGSRTLAIYLVHPLVINVAVVWYGHSALGEALRGSTLADVLLVPAVTLLAVLVAVAGHEIVARCGLGGVFAAPRRRRREDTGASVQR